VTRNKPAKLARAVRCFTQQQYMNKELVLVYEDDDDGTHELVISGGLDPHSRAIRVPASPKLTLGALRNLAIREARGEYFCQWDDDDWYHEDRVGRQVEAVIGSRREACLLTNWLIFDEVERRAYFSHFRLWEGSILCRRDVALNEVRYPSIARNEDNVFTTELITRGYVFPLTVAGLYIYTAHAGNTWPRAHFQRIFSRSKVLGAELSSLVEDILLEKYSVPDASALLRSERLLAQLNYFPEYERLRPRQE
jgi:glycosyltransferase involved in cell wall biosynthesis